MYLELYYRQLNVHCFYTGVPFSIAFCCSIFELGTKNIKKLEQNCFENCYLFFWAFLLLCDLVSNIFYNICQGFRTMSRKM